MDINQIIKRVLNMVTKPKEEWQAVKDENLGVTDIFTRYAVILAAIPAVAGFIGFCIIGFSFGYGTWRMPIGSGLAWMIMQFAFALGGAYLTAFIIDALAPSFGALKDMNRSFQAVVFSSAPLWVAGVVFILPTLSVVIWFFSIYCLYLLYLGIEALKEPPKDKMVGYFVVIIIVSIVVQSVAYFLVRAITFPRAWLGF